MHRGVERKVECAACDARFRARFPQQIRIERNNVDVVQGRVRLRIRVRYFHPAVERDRARVRRSLDRTGHLERGRFGERRKMQVVDVGPRVGNQDPIGRRLDGFIEEFHRAAFKRDVIDHPIFLRMCGGFA